MHFNSAYDIPDPPGADPFDIPLIVARNTSFECGAFTRSSPLSPARLAFIAVSCSTDVKTSGTV
jgi:hypothetical protein